MIESVEIYPRIVVYKNMFKDIGNTLSIIKDSETNKSGRIFSQWSKWSSFGEYLNAISNNVDWDQERICADFSNIGGDYDIDQRSVIDELMSNFKNISSDYSQRYNIDLKEDGWEWTAPVICKYNNIVDEDRLMTMRYHSDYIWEPIVSPGTKFAITALAYFNDDYDGGEIDFAVGKNLIKYKPVAGDFLVFPSGNPEILTEEGTVYLHGVLPVRSGNNKIFSRMFWKKYHPGSDEWHKNEHKYGKEVWGSMQDSIMKEFRMNHPQRSVIENGVRLE
jgi:hypothetical protein